MRGRGFRRVGRVDVRAVALYLAAAAAVVGLSTPARVHPVLVGIAACLAMVVVAFIGLALHLGTGVATVPGRGVVGVAFEGGPATMLRVTPSIQATRAAFLAAPGVGILAGSAAAFGDRWLFDSVLIGAGVGVAALVPAVMYLAHRSVQGVLLTATELVVHDAAGEQRLRWADVQRVHRCERHVHVTPWRPDQLVVLDPQEARRPACDLRLDMPSGGLTTVGLMRLVANTLGHPVDEVSAPVMVTSGPVDPAASAVFGTSTGVDAVHRLTFAGALTIPAVLHVRPDEHGDPQRAALIDVRAALLERQLVEGRDFVVDGFDPAVDGEPLRVRARGDLLEIGRTEDGAYRPLARVATAADARQVLLERLDPELRRTPPADEPEEVAAGRRARWARANDLLLADPTAVVVPDDAWWTEPDEG